MKHLKTFEQYNDSQIKGTGMEWFPTPSEEDLTNFYKCDSCNAVWRLFNDTTTECRFCKGYENGKAIQISDFDYYGILKDRLEPSEFKEEMKNRKKRSEKFIDLMKVGADKTKREYKKNLN